MQHCRLDQSNSEPAPGTVTATLAGAGAGNVDNGAHRYLATFTTATGETQAGTVSASLTVADKTTNGKVSLTGIPTGGALVTGRKLYRTIAGGTTYLLLATIADNTTTIYTDNMADAGLGAGAPTTNTTDDPLLGMLIASARAAAEQELHRYLVTQTLEMYLDFFPGADPTWKQICRGNLDDYAIRMPPLQSVTSINYIDTSGATVLLAADQYTVDTKSQPARILPAYGLAWPSARDQINAVIIRFVAGYGVASVVPQCVKNWMLIRIKTLFENRDQIVVGTNGLVVIPPSFIDSLLDPERVYGLK
jgi:uncharacterized phiE125 gp8 family phage protein